MNAVFSHLSCLLIAFTAFLVTGCNESSEKGREEALPLRIGVIATLTGSASAWGEATVRCAEIMADHYNEKGGILIDGERRKIELLIRDDEMDRDKALNIAYEFTLIEGIQYVIGPLVDDVVVEVAPVLDAADVVYVHYGSGPDLLKSESLGLLGMPTPPQTLPLLLEFVRSKRKVDSVGVIARNSPEALRQKELVEGIAVNLGLDVKRFSGFDISEETFDLLTHPDEIRARMLQLLSKEPDAVILNGLAPDEFPVAVQYLREVGFNGPLIAQNSQDPTLLLELGDAAKEIFFVGGSQPKERQTYFYKEMRERYLDIAPKWSEEVGTKLYAMETLLRIIQLNEQKGNGDIRALFDSLHEFSYSDPFLVPERQVALVGQTIFGVNRQISVPVILSEFVDGRLETVRITEIAD